MRIARVSLVFAAAITLNGCFQSDQPLIAESDSVTPIKPGKYVSTNPEETDSVAISIKGGITIFTGDEPMALLMRNLKDSFFIGMVTPVPGAPPDKEDDGSRLYMLIRVENDAMTSYDASDACKELETLAKEKGRKVSDFGVVRVHSGGKQEGQTFGSDDACYFDRFDKLAGAFQTLLDEKLLDEDEAYKRVN